MLTKTHTYDVALTWMDNRGEGTSSYRSYGRDHEVSAPSTTPILGSADPSFRGDPARWNPEQLQVAAVAQCHMLWYLHLAASAGVIVTGYSDHPHGIMVEDSDGGGGGQFVEVILRPHVTIRVADEGASGQDVEASVELARRLHEDVGAKCFIARSVNFAISHKPVILVEGRTDESGRV